ncbi:MAG TPA: M50 family metallopeptidase [Bacillota bacterium]|nr:M50 family metallopeptidase [Bacillota bacterium]
MNLMTSYYVMIPYTLLILNILVVVHEFGHFWVARRCGVRTPEFSVGFGPLLWKTVKNGVQYSIRAVPLGGFVKIEGMDIALEGDGKGGETTENLPPNETFAALPLWKKLAIIIAGPFNNLILAFLSLILITVCIGIPYRYVDNRAKIGGVEFKSPAYESGLKTGDVVVAINRKHVKTWEDLARIVNASPKKSLLFTVQRNGQSFDLSIKPFYDPHYKIGRIGISPPLLFKRIPLKEAIVKGSQYGVDSFREVIYALGRLIVGKERATGVGPIGMVGMMKQAAESSLFQFFFIFPMLNLFLGIFNLLPIPLPLLDGGWVSILILEKLRRKEFSAEQKAMAQMIGMGLMIFLFVLITYGDIASQIKYSLHLRGK